VQSPSPGRDTAAIPACSAARLTAAGLDDEAIESLLRVTLQAPAEEDIA